MPKMTVTWEEGDQVVQEEVRDDDGEVTTPAVIETAKDVNGHRLIKVAHATGFHLSYVPDTDYDAAMGALSVWKHMGAPAK